MSPWLHQTIDHDASHSVLLRESTHFPSQGRATQVGMLFEPAVLPALDSRVILHAVEEHLRPIRVPALLAGLGWRAHAGLRMPHVALPYKWEMLSTCDK